MEREHLDRQPPRDEAEQREQDRLIEEAPSDPPPEPPTDAPDPELA